jgi:hypothetical protein
MRAAFRAQLTQEPKALRPKFHREEADTGDVAAGPVEAGAEASLDRIDANRVHDRNGRGRGFGRKSRGDAARGHDDGHRTADQISHQFRQPIACAMPPAVFDRDIAALGIAGLSEPLCEIRPRILRSLRANPDGETRSPASPAAAPPPRAAKRLQHRRAA